MMMRNDTRLEMLVVFSLVRLATVGFLVISFTIPRGNTIHCRQCYCRLFATSQQLGLGEYAVTVPKPLGMILEERDEGLGGVCVKEVNKENGSAWKIGIIAPGDVLLTINEKDVSNADFDSVMDLLVADEDSASLTRSDGLGQLHMPKIL